MDKVIKDGLIFDPGISLWPKLRKQPGSSLARTPSTVRRIEARSIADI